MPKWLKIYLSGALMGAADVVPGVSGGTIAFIVGIYDRLISALSGVNLSSIRMLLKGDFKGLWQHFDGTFLVTLLLGIVSSIFGIAHIVTELLVSYPVWLWSFFFGLILASAYILICDIDRFSLRHGAALTVGIIVGAALSILVPTQVNISLLMVFLAGMIAICAMILPGVSGSFLLLIMGMYGYVMEAVKSFDVVVICVFAVGALTGLLSFSKLLNWLLRNAKSLTLALLTGVMLGALVKVWPWKEVVTYIDVGDKRLPAQEQLMMPWNIANFDVADSLVIPLILFLMGAVLVILMHYISLQKVNLKTNDAL
ncbi:DUF368 domain-containing protein [Marinomonas piezotolerans]|uniref:DUF368 domain-containing protein n=1 Tax=Marinomonas piezotolerans TaxID=2213058 RepID=A0A370U4F7_9GAMM|nr:DUF368 domain-containing protein [Marinomonas piezotolerans]RDL42670.1 DUF368 domain-containing protein [Marinomonas piezotolerans]